MTDGYILSGLNPADYFTLAMDQAIRNEGMPGSLCGFAIILSEPPKLTELSARIAAFSQQYPLTLASLRQKGRRYYWFQRSEKLNNFFHHNDPAANKPKQYEREIIDQIFNRREALADSLALEFHLISSRDRQCFLMRWLHPLFDARGAGLILNYLCSDQQQALPEADSTSLVNIQLQKFPWWEKIHLLYKGRQLIKRLDQLSSILPYQSTEKPKTLIYRQYKFSIQETELILKNARQYAGMTGTSLYYIGCFMRALEHINPEHPGEAYCVPYAFNLRKQKALTPLLGNHVCALFAQVSRSLIKDKSRLFEHLTQQNKNAIRQKLDFAFLPLMWAGSWLSMQRYGETLRKSYQSGEERASFWFSDIGPSDLSNLKLAGSAIDDVFHLCQLPSPPGLGLLSCIFKQQLTFTYNAIEPFFDPEALNHLHQVMRNELLDDTVSDKLTKT